MHISVEGSSEGTEEEKKKKRAGSKCSLPRVIEIFGMPTTFFQLKLSFKNGFQDVRWNVIGE